MPNYCTVCGLSKAKDPSISLYRIPKEPELRKIWLESLSLTDDKICAESRVCSRHFRDGNPKNIPSLHIGKSFSNRPTDETVRGKRRASRELLKHKRQSEPPPKRPCVHSHSPRSSTPTSAISASFSLSSPTPLSPLPTSLSSPILSPSSVSYTPELVSTSVRSSRDCSEVSSISFLQSEDGSACSIPGAYLMQSRSEVQVTVDVAWSSQIQMLKSQLNKLQGELDEAKRAPFRVECVAHDDTLISLYTGFPSYDVLLSFYKFLGPAVNALTYWGTSRKTQKKRRMKLDRFNQLFMTLVKLKLDLNIRDMAFRFQISKTTVSRYFITWFCFLYNELKEVAWFPSKEQVAGTLPHSFRERYPTTVAIIDASEIFVETPSDLALQSTAWSSYKHHNTLKFLVACTPNGSISFISSLYLGSISDPALTRSCGFFQQLEGMPGVSIMADRGFTIKESLSRLNIELNLPPFMEGRGQLPPEEMQQGRSIASLRIHVERAIGRMKQYKMLAGVFPLKMARIANQIVTVCAYLSNFHPALSACSRFSR